MHAIVLIILSNLCNTNIMAASDTSLSPVPLLEKLTFPHRGDTISGIRIYADGTVLMYHGVYEYHHQNELWQSGLTLSGKGIDKLTTYLNNEFSHLDGKTESTRGSVVYRIRTPEKEYRVAYKNIAYDMLPPELLELEKLINGHIQQSQQH